MDKEDKYDYGSSITQTKIDLCVILLAYIIYYAQQQINKKNNDIKNDDDMQINIEI